jgi:hypothetical protein
MHLPPWQLVEQQSPGSVQASPSVLHALAPGSGWQVVLGVPEQRPVQHSVAAPQAAPVDLHSVSEQTPTVQVPEQQSLGLTQEAPGTPQKMSDVQVWVVWLHAVEQQSPLIAQVVPPSWHVETGTSQRSVLGLQYWSQHSALPVQVAPVFLQDGGLSQTLVGSQ